MEKDRARRETVKEIVIMIKKLGMGKMVYQFLLFIYSLELFFLIKRYNM